LRLIDLEQNKTWSKTRPGAKQDLEQNNPEKIVSHCAPQHSAQDSA
jgi:hypothetical protein